MISETHNRKNMLFTELASRVSLKRVRGGESERERERQLELFGGKTRGSCRTRWRTLADWWAAQTFSLREREREREREVGTGTHAATHRRRRQSLHTHTDTAHVCTFGVCKDV